MATAQLANGTDALEPYGDDAARNAVYTLSEEFGMPLWADLAGSPRATHVPTGSHMAGGELPTAKVVHNTTGVELPVFSLSIESTDERYGHLVHFWDWENPMEHLTRVQVTVTASPASGGSGPAPDDFWTRYLNGPDIFIELGTPTTHPAPNTIYDIAVSATSNQGIRRSFRLKPTRCRQ